MMELLQTVNVTLKWIAGGSIQERTHRTAHAGMSLSNMAREGW